MNEKSQRYRNNTSKRQNGGAVTPHELRIQTVLDRGEWARTHYGVRICEGEDHPVGMNKKFLAPGGARFCKYCISRMSKARREKKAAGAKEVLAAMRAVAARKKELGLKY